MAPTKKAVLIDISESKEEDVEYVPRNELSEYSWLALNDKWLKSSCINIYLSKLIRTLDESTQQKILFLFTDLFYYSSNVLKYFVSKSTINQRYLIVPFADRKGDRSRHWLLGMIDLLEKKIVILDSYRSSLKLYDEYFKKLFLICCLHNRCVGREEVYTIDFNFLVCDDSPKQDNAYDCGVIACFIVNSVVSGKELKFKSKEFRKQISDYILNDNILYDDLDIQSVDSFIDCNDILDENSKFNINLKNKTVKRMTISYTNFINNFKL